MRVITIDGPAGAGKSTVAQEIARRLGIFFLDTGAMYRALTLKALRQGVDLEDEGQLVEAVRRTKIEFGRYPGGKIKVLLDGKDVTEEIRTPEVTNKTFYIARDPRVRAIVVDWQRDIGAKKSVVAEGRDVGTVVFPQATHKFYLDADFEERSRRRIKELREKGQAVDADNLKKDLEERDRKDLTRSVGPLKRAEDAVVIDSTHLCADEVVEEMLKYIEGK
jgi:cytidylate kinase